MLNLPRAKPGGFPEGVFRVPSPPVHDAVAEAVPVALQV